MYTLISRQIILYQIFRRLLSDSEGFSIVPDFLCREAVETGKIKSVWEGAEPLENTLYFGTRKKTIYQFEIDKLEKILKNKYEGSAVYSQPS